MIDKSTLEPWQLMPITNSVVQIIEFITLFNKYRLYDSYTTNRNKAWESVLACLVTIDVSYLESQVSEYKTHRTRQKKRIESAKSLDALFARIISEKAEAEKEHLLIEYKEAA